ncbi:MAG TPA: L,D-transpeptidase family protein, partial [Flavobacterium sp.]
YRYVQSPGSHNSLGCVKIIFPNRFSVYLHDTNHRNYFTKADRSLSSGCVRVQNVLKLTEYLIDDQKSWPEEKINLLIESLKTTSVKIKKNYYLQQLYWTAWSEGDQLIFRKDIYSLDNTLYDMLRN